MPGGHKNINGSDGNTFSSENQPSKRRGKSMKNKFIEAFQEDPSLMGDIVKVVSKKAKSGDLKAIEFIRDTTEGKPTQRIETNLDLPKPKAKNFIDYDNE